MTTEIRRVNRTQASVHCGTLDLNPAEREAMDYCLAMSEFMWVGLIDDRLMCIWGLIPATLMSNQAYLWLHTTDLLKEHQFVFVRHSQLVMENVLQEYHSVVGHAVVGSNKTIKWLKWLGAKFGQPQMAGIPFRIGRSG